MTTRHARWSDRDRLHDLLLAERDEVLTLLRELDDTQWATATLCDGWTVRDVVAHLVGWDTLLIHRSKLTAPQAAARYAAAHLRAHGSTDNINRTFIERYDRLDNEELVERFEALATGSPRWLFEHLSPGAQLAEYVIHHEDIRRPLGVDRTIPPDLLVAALSGIAKLPGVGVKQRLRHNRWIATDTAWSAGVGDAIYGPALDILVALAGRPHPSSLRACNDG